MCACASADCFMGLRATNLIRNAGKNVRWGSERLNPDARRGAHRDFASLDSGDKFGLPIFENGAGAFDAALTDIRQLSAFPRRLRRYIDCKLQPAPDRPIGNVGPA